MRWANVALTLENSLNFPQMVVDDLSLDGRSCVTTLPADDIPDKGID